ncbi:MAG TPA: tetratricopeptide repeat protein, partial [Acidimicrobiales bacterium]|nr:tetratricopeptide repeat protein [Acidimicrobiales bacterium]
TEKELLEVDDDRWSFRSDLVRDVAYGTLTKARRAAGHAGIAKWLEHHETGDNAPTAMIDRIAHHYAIAADLVADVGTPVGVPDDVRERALHWLERATDAALASEHHLVGLRLTTQILELLGDDTGPQAVAALTRRARCGIGIRELDGARADLTKAIAHADGRGDDAAYGEALVVLGDLEMKAGDPVTSREILTRAAGILDDIGEEAIRGEALRLRGMAELYVGDREAATRSIEDALEVARSVGNQREEAWALQNLAWTAYESGHAEVAEQHLEASVAVFSGIGDTGGLGWAQGLLAWVKFHRGDFTDAEALAERLLPETGHRGDKWAEGMLRMLIASVRMWTGRCDEALGPAEAALANMQKADDAGGQVQATGTVARILLAMGRIEDGIAAVERGLALGRETDQPQGFAGQVVAVLSYVALGDPERARAALEGIDVDALDVAAIGQSDALIGVALALLQSGEVERATFLLDRMAGSPDPQNHPASASALALARAATGDRDAVERLTVGTLAARRATYHDRAQALLAAMLAATAAGDDIRAIDLAAQVTDLVAATQDRLLQTVVSIMTEEALGPDAPAGSRLPGIEAEGWRNVARLALGAAPLATP